MKRKSTSLLDQLHEGLEFMDGLSNGSKSFKAMRKTKIDSSVAEFDSEHVNLLDNIFHPGVPTNSFSQVLNKKIKQP